MVPAFANSVDNYPDPLFEQCIKYVLRNLYILANSDPFTKFLQLKEGLTLPSVICEKLLDFYQHNGYVVDDRFVNLFKNPDAARLNRIKLRNSTISDDGLCMLVSSNPVELDITNCSRLSGESLTHINRNGEKLVSLSLSSSSQVLPDTLMTECHRRDEDNYERRGYILKTPNLKKLTVRKLYVPGEKIYFQLLLNPLKKLTYLDLSGCFDLGNLSYLAELPNLTSLVLFNVQRLQSAVPSIMKLTNLKHLDISQLNEIYGTFRIPNQTLASLVESLPNLVSLDISGTNLAGTGVADQSLKQGKQYVLTDIPGLRSRVDRPFEFLGLYRTHREACNRHNIPAKRISGDANEEQTLTAVQAYLDRTDVLTNVLSDLYQLFRYEKCDNVDTALRLLLEAMDRHLYEKHIQISGSAILFYIAKLIAKKPFFKVKVKRHFINTLINAMGAFQDDETVIRNACLTLIQFNVPDDMLFDYERLVLLLLYVVSEHQNFVQRIGVFLLNSLACQVDEAQKQLFGNLGTVDRMLALITDRLQRKVCDDVLEIAWSTMWNITDETVENCQRFLAENGMELFLACLSMFPRKEELLRNMMGLLGNVAEMKSLRPFLMTDRFVSVFADLLGSCCDGIEVSYNAAGVLAHMCSDGEEAWTVKEPKRETVLRKIVWAIRRWNLTTQRNINYRSFQPIFGLLKVTHTEECQYWAVWALANLTTVYRDKYCPLVLNEGGIELLQNVIQTEHSHRAINKLAKKVIKNCKEV
ncbi:hypothetical protein RUM43_002834 [Polyplax serrata]|uniref:Protein zer-1 homolog n=1 Tax=Polyplax serrata TaxID=468196 RepID=A0AAN8S547_POLSC